MSNEMKSMAFTCETGQTVLIGQEIRLTIQQIFKAKNGRTCLKLLVKVPKTLEVFQTKRSFEEMASANPVSPNADLLKILKNVLKTPAGQEALALSEGNPATVTVKKRISAHPKKLKKPIMAGETNDE